MPLCKKFHSLLMAFSALLIASTSLNANDCGTANALTSEEDFALSQVSGSFLGAGFSGIAQCTGPGGSDDVWYSFVAVATDHGIQATGAGDIDIAIGLYDACGGSLLSCTNNNGIGGTETALVTSLTPGNTYFYRVFHAGGVAATSDSFTTAVAHIPFVELVPSDCGATDLTTNDVIRATPPSNTDNFTDYQFRFVELEAPFTTYTITSPNGTNPNFLLQWFPQIEYGRSYEVSVRVRAILPAFGDFSNTCTITMLSDVLSPSLESQYVNGFFNFCDIIGATKVALASEYQWTFLNLDDLSSLQVSGLSDSRLLNLYRVPDLQLGTSYAVGVRAVVAGATSGAGSLSFLNMNNAVPNTGLNSTIYPCGQTYANGSFLQAIEVCRAESYTWRFTNTSVAQPAILYTRNDGSRFVDLDFVSGLNEGDSYDVEVLASQGGLVGDYSSVCNITIGAAPMGLLSPTVISNEPSSFSPEHSTIQKTVREENLVLIQPDWDVEITRNSQTSNQFNITFSSEDISQTAFAHVYDLNGRLINELGNILLDAGATARVNLDQFPSGIYFVRIGNDAYQETHKLLVF